MMIKYDKNENTQHALNWKGKQFLQADPGIKKQEMIDLFSRLP